jgi:hypothetical protein
MDFDYKKYSLEQLENWMHDVLSSTETTSQEIYDVIKKVVQEQYDYYKDGSSRTNELLCLLNGHKQSTFTLYDSSDYLSFDNMNYPAYSVIGNTEDTIDLAGNNLSGLDLCGIGNTSEYCANSWNNFWEENYYPEEYAKSQNEKTHSEHYYEYSRNDLNRKNPFKSDKPLVYESPDSGKTVYSRELGKTERTLVKEDKVKKWILPVEVDGPSGEYYVIFPDDLLEQAGWEESDELNWVDNKDGTFTLTKVTRPLGMDEC